MSKRTDSERLERLLRAIHILNTHANAGLKSGPKNMKDLYRGQQFAANALLVVDSGDEKAINQLVEEMGGI